MGKVKIWIAGPRAWESPKPIYVIVKRLQVKYEKNLVICEGGAPGVDTGARKVCEKLRIPCFENKALWDKFGRAAGPIRNGLIADVFEPQLLVAFHYKELEDHRGTWNAVAQAHDRRIQVKLIHVKPEIAMPSAYSVHAPGSAARRAAKGKPRRKRRA